MFTRCNLLRTIQNVSTNNICSPNNAKLLIPHQINILSNGISFSFLELKYELINQ